MIQYLTKLEELRTRLLKCTKHLTTQQINYIPPGFKNNIIWNIGHELAVSDDILYGNIESMKPQYPFDITKFKKGSKPEQIVDTDTVASIKEAFGATVPNFLRLMSQASLAHPELQYDKVVRRIISNASLSFLIFHEEMHIQVVDRMLLLL